jgi:hypothetical protein
MHGGIGDSLVNEKARRASDRATGQKGLNSMITIQKREQTRNYFPESVEKNHHQADRVAAVRRVGPRWVTAGHRPRAIPVFFIHRTILSVPPASVLSLPETGSGKAGAVVPGVAQ